MNTTSQRARYSWVLYKPQASGEILERSGIEGRATGLVDPVQLAVDMLAKHSFGADAGDCVVNVYGADDRLVAWSQWEDGIAAAYLADETARLTADVVLFGDFEGALWVLLIERGWEPFKGSWALPGGHLDQGEDTEDAAHRELTEETGIRAGHLAYVGAYAAPGRDPRGRYVTFAYVGRMPHRFEPTAGDDAVRAEWVRLDDVLSGRCLVAFDHYAIIEAARHVGIYGQRLNP